MTHPGGRPTEYSEDIIFRSKEYIDSCEDETYTQVKTEGDKSTSWENKIRVKLPTIEGLALYLGLHKDTLYQWEKIHKKFSDVLTDLRNKQADRLINNGISGDYNSTIAKVLLTKHGYREGTDVTSNEKTITFEREEADKAIDNLLNGGN